MLPPVDLTAASRPIRVAFKPVRYIVALRESALRHKRCGRGRTRA